MNNIFQAIQKSFDLLDQEGTKQSSLMTAWEFMLKIANESKYETEECSFRRNQENNIEIVLKTKKAVLTITANSRISYTGTGQKQADKIHIISTETYYDADDSVLDWIKRNRK